MGRHGAVVSGAGRPRAQTAQRRAVGRFRPRRDHRPVAGAICVLSAAFAVGFGGLIVWWRRLRASNDRVWADDVAQITHGTVAGNCVTLENVRNFAWRTQTDYTERWETRRYDLERLNSVDMIMSYWSRRSIAHMLVSFGFDDGERVAFSVEVRRERHEGYSEIGGFFKDFELSIIAADERDVVRLRTNVRGEDTYLYRVRMPVTAMRSLVPGLCRGGQHSRRGTAFLSDDHRQLHDAGLSIHETHLRPPALRLSRAVVGLHAGVRLQRRRSRPALLARGAPRASAGSASAAGRPTGAMHFRQKSAKVYRAWERRIRMCGVRERRAPTSLAKQLARSADQRAPHLIATPCGRAGPLSKTVLKSSANRESSTRSSSVIFAT